MKKLLPVLASIFLCGVAFNTPALAQAVSSSGMSSGTVKHKTTHKRHAKKKHHASRHLRARSQSTAGSAAVVPGNPPVGAVTPAPATTPPGTAATNTPDLGNNAGTQTQTGIGANIHQKSGD